MMRVHLKHIMAALKISNTSCVLSNMFVVKKTASEDILDSLCIWEYKNVIRGNRCVLLIDVHLRTKADLYSLMQCSFVKIKDLIGFVSEYMLTRPKPTYQATYVCKLFVMTWARIKLLLASANSSRTGIIHLYELYIVNIW
jgi:hypothetical protein